MGGIRSECFDHTLILHGRQLRRVVKEYIAYFNQERPHQGIGQRIPIFYGQLKNNSKRRITSKAILGSLHHSYSRVTNLN
jgi:putative transposase